MKTTIFIFLIAVLIGCQVKDEPVSSINLPLTIVKGYGPFNPAFSLLGKEHLSTDPAGAGWVKTYLPIRGIPAKWRSVSKSMIHLNIRQLVYQNYVLGNITSDMYSYLQKSWKWKPDELKLSKKPIKCYVYVIWGINSEGNWMAMVDTNNNLDFSDEKAFYPEVIDSKKNASSTLNEQIVKYQIYQNNQIIEAEIPLVIKQIDTNQFGYNFPQYAKVELIQNGEKHELAVVPSGLNEANFEDIGIVEMAGWEQNKVIEDSELIEKEQYITIGGLLGTKYKNKGVDLFNNVLQLEGIPSDVVVYSTQAGYQFQPFSAKEFSTKKEISLQSLKGKYVFIDFWGTWCRGCVEEIPNLVNIYKGLDKSRFEFVGIVAGDTSEKLKNFIDKNGVTWPQIISDDSNKLVEVYKITGYPQTVLIDPSGKVIAKDLRGKELEVKLNELARKTIE
jgi:peroxiredoxin